MSALTLRLEARIEQRVDCSPLTPETLGGLSLDAIRGVPLQVGCRRVPAGELFRVTGDDARDLVIQGATDRLDRIGWRMSHGTLRIEGHAGGFLGHEMEGGQIELTGDAGAWVAAAMRGGVIRVKGNAGDFLGAAPAGERRGMRGGTVLVHGAVGARAGDYMRRGMVLVAGDAGAGLGSRMIAGTLAVLGQAGGDAGIAMTRGSLILARPPASIPPTFNACGRLPLDHLRLMLRAWHRWGAPFDTLDADAVDVERHVGDRATGGQGEILILPGA